MATAAGAGGDVHRVLYDAVALCSASCAEMTTTNPTMKGAATPVTVRLEKPLHPHLTRLPIDSASASPTSRPRRATLSYPTRRQAIRGARYDVIEKVRGLCLTRKHGSGEDGQQIEIQHGKSTIFIDPFI